MQPISPKGKFRLLLMLCVGLSFITIAAVFDPQNQLVLGALTSLLRLGYGLIAVALFYRILRDLLHVRTHELVDANKQFQFQVALMVSAAIVFGFAIS